MTSADKKNGRSLITLALFAYNHQDFIRQAVLSALSQDYPFLEIIISDDASNDSTLDIIKDIVSHYEGSHRVMVNENTTNLGLIDHVNQVVEMANGEWIVMAAGDDISRTDRCSKLFAATSCFPDAVSVSSAYNRIDASGTILPDQLPKRYLSGRVDLHGKSSWTERYIHGKDIGTTGATSMWHKKLFREFGPIPTQANSEDSVLGFRSYLFGTVIYTSDRLVEYRCHASNICNIDNLSIWEKEIHQQNFLKKSFPTIEAMRKDYIRHSNTCPNTNDSNLPGKVVDWSSALIQRRGEWWEVSPIIRLKKTWTVLLSGNWNDFRWCFKRTFGRRAFILIQSSIKEIKSIYLLIRFHLSKTAR